ncbi:MAG: hypothetical protein ACRCYV_04065 [Aeromonas sp.]
MSLLKRFLDLIPGADPLLVGTVLTDDGQHSTLETLAGGVIIVRGTGVGVGQPAFYRGHELIGEAPALPTYEIEV